jgi:hypothetical protein
VTCSQPAQMSMWDAAGQPSDPDPPQRRPRAPIDTLPSTRPKRSLGREHEVGLDALDGPATRTGWGSTLDAIDGPRRARPARRRRARATSSTRPAVSCSAANTRGRSTSTRSPSPSARSPPRARPARRYRDREPRARGDARSPRRAPRRRRARGGARRVDQHTTAASTRQRGEHEAQLDAGEHEAALNHAAASCRRRARGGARGRVRDGRSLAAVRPTASFHARPAARCGRGHHGGDVRTGRAGRERRLSVSS